jgi:hypothetical protein
MSQATNANATNSNSIATAAAPANASAAVSASVSDQRKPKRSSKPVDAATEASLVALAAAGFDKRGRNIGQYRLPLACLLTCLPCLLVCLLARAGAGSD